MVFLLIAAVSWLAKVCCEAEPLLKPRAGIVKNVPTDPKYNGCLVVRKGPGMSFPVLGHIVNGDAVVIEGTEGSWMKISSPKSGYVWASYIEITDTEPLEPDKVKEPLPLEVIMFNSNPEKRAKQFEKRQQLLRDAYTMPDSSPSTGSE